jgi:hypothetical protein
MNDVSEELESARPKSRTARDDSACRRAYARLAGPFEATRIGRLETRVTLYDLSQGGAFVNSMYEQQAGTTLTLKIDLAVAGEITVKAQTLYCRPGGYAVRFIDLTPEEIQRFASAIHVLQDTGY